jgi:hypothetical protein
VMTQVDLVLTNVSRFDLADSVISVNDAKQKPGASQPTPRKKNLVPRFDYKIKVIPAIMTRGYKGKRHLCYTFQYRNSDGTKGTRCVLYSLIAVHEEAGEECAHGQLIADKFCVRCRDTSLSTSSEMTRTLPRTESWVSAWLKSFFRPTSILDVVDEYEGTSCSARNGTYGRDALVAG